MGILWTIIIGFIAGVIAKFIMPGDNEPSGFIMTTILGIVGAYRCVLSRTSPPLVQPGRRCRAYRCGRRGDHRLVRVWSHHEPANDLNDALMARRRRTGKHRRR